MRLKKRRFSETNGVTLWNDSGNSKLVLGEYLIKLATPHLVNVCIGYGMKDVNRKKDGNQTKK